MGKSSSPGLRRGTPPYLVLQLHSHLVTCCLRHPVPVVPSRRIRAGTELTWDYNYEVGSVEGKELLCCCGAIE